MPGWCRNSTADNDASLFHTCQVHMLVFMTSKADLAFAQENEVIPPDVRLVRDFVNTVEYQVADERLERPADLARWLAERRLLTGEHVVTDAQLAFARTLREGLRVVLEQHAGHAADEAEVGRLDRALADLPVRVVFGPRDGFVLAPAGVDPVMNALARVLDAIRSSSAGGTWDRLKACSRESCRWAYFDHSRNRSGRWCTMAGCGNIVKMRRAYASRTAVDSAPR